MKSQTKEVRTYVKELIIAPKQENMTNRAIADTLDISGDYVRHVLEMYRNNNSLPEEKQRGRAIGEKCKLSLKIEEEIKRQITQTTTDQQGLSASLWLRTAMQEFIENKYDIYILIRTISTYLKHWGMTCQRPYNKSYN